MMKRTTIIICLLSLIVSIHGLRTRIYGGSDAPEARYPYYAYLSSVTKVDAAFSCTYCGGSIIDKRWILTAAHCFQGIDFKTIEVKVGSVFRSGASGAIYRVEKRVVHEAFSEDTFANDIALLRVNRDIAFNPKALPIALANRDTVIEDNENAVFTGFGRVEDQSRPERLKYVTLKMQGYGQCKKVEARVTESQICTIPIQGRGPCVGDSGGPLVNENDVQVGISSHSYDNGTPKCGKIPEIYTRVSSFRDWIDQKIRQS